MQIPVPPQFMIISERPFHNSIYCTSLEYSAEEDFIYLPFWMLSELGYKVLNTNRGTFRNVKSGYGLTVTTLDVRNRYSLLSYTIPKCYSIEYFLDSDYNCSDIKRELTKYLFVREQTDMSIYLNNSIVIVKILKVLPAPISTLDGIFELKKASAAPETPKVRFEKEPKIETPFYYQNQTEPLSKFKDRIPKFLNDLIVKQELLKNDYFVQKKLSPLHKKNFSCLPPESPRIVTQRETTPEIIEKYLETTNKAMETGKSIEDCEWHLPSVYNSPLKVKMSPPALLTITIPEYPNKISARKTYKVAIRHNHKKERSATPLVLKKVRLDMGSMLFNADTDQRYLKGTKLFSHL